ncbi:hypothetical protein GCM10018783_41820 [Streptomyces griseosporeus]|nr:hypothetical protein GCM10018783_41820 [Streptomyces griseosporeus]
MHCAVSSLTGALGTGRERACRTPSAAKSAPARRVRLANEPGGQLVTTALGGLSGSGPGWSATVAAFRTNPEKPVKCVGMVKPGLSANHPFGGTTWKGAAR